MSQPTKHTINSSFGILDTLRQCQEKLGIDQNHAKKLCMVLSDTNNRQEFFNILDNYFNWTENNQNDNDDNDDAEQFEYEDDNDDNDDDEGQIMAIDTNLKPMRPKDELLAWGDQPENQVYVPKGWAKKIKEICEDKLQNETAKEMAWNAFDAECKNPGKRVDVKRVRRINLSDPAHFITNKNKIIRIAIKSIQNSMVAGYIKSCMANDDGSEIAIILNIFAALLGTCSWQCRAHIMNKWAYGYLQWWNNNTGLQISNYAKNEKKKSAELLVGDATKGIIFLVNYDEDTELCIVPNKWHGPGYYSSMQSIHIKDTIVIGTPWLKCKYNIVPAIGIYLAKLLVEKYATDKWKKEVAIELLKVKYMYIYFVPIILYVHCNIYRDFIIMLQHNVLHTIG